MISPQTAIRKLFQGAIRVYACAVSPFLGRNCRYHPSCSAYAHEAIGRHGAAKGSVLAFRRIMRCHPWSRAGWDDPVPRRIAWRDLLGYKRAGAADPPRPDEEK